MAECQGIHGLLYCLALVPTIVFLGLEAQIKRVIGGRMRVYNAVDLSLMTVFYHVVFEALCDAVFASADWRDQGARRRCRRTAAALILVFQVGRSVHIAADAIHTYATEIHPEYRIRLPPDLLELIYFLDEDLGHWLLFIPYYCLLALLTCCSPGQCAAAAALLLLGDGAAAACDAIASRSPSDAWRAICRCGCPKQQVAKRPGRGQRHRGRQKGGREVKRVEPGPELRHSTQKTGQVVLCGGPTGSCGSTRGDYWGEKR